MNTGSIIKSHEGHTLTLTIKNKANILSRKIMELLHKALDEAESDADVEEVVITGYGKIFSAGADLNEVAEFVLNEKNMSPIEQREAALEFCRVGQELILRLRRFPKPVTALVNGACLGGGLELALGCHKIIATPDAYLGLPEITRGLIPGGGGTYFLSRRINLERAKIMIAEGAPVTAQRAFELGLVDEILPGEIPKRNFDFPPPAPRLARALIDFVHFQFYGCGDDAEDALEEAAHYFAETCTAEGSEAKEGILAFREKREPKFKEENKKS